MDKIMTDFLRGQEQKGASLAAASDIFSLTPLAGDPTWRYLLEFDCTGLVHADGEVVEADHFVVGLSFGPDHLRERPDIPRLLTWLEPQTAWHPNIRFPFICIGDVNAGTGIVDIAHRVFEVITYQKLMPVEWDALNRDACVWSRDNLQRFPVDGRPLKRLGLFPDNPENKGLRE